MLRVGTNVCGTGIDAHVVWDSHIEAACSTVNSVIDVLSVKYPQFVKSS